MKRAGNYSFSVALGIILGLGLWLTAMAPRSASQAVPPRTTPPVTTQLPPDAPKPPYRRITGPETLNPGEYPQHWPYPDEYDSAVGASEVHHIRYIDTHVRFVEVAYFPGVHGQMHGHPWASVFAVDAPVPKAYNVNLDPENAPHRSAGPSKWLEPMPPAKDVKPAAGAPKFSTQWPYPIAYDSVKAAPNNYRLLYEDDHVRLVEVMIRPGETENMAGDPYPSVIADDAISGPQGEDHPLDPKSSLNGQGAGHAAPPPGLESPTCSTIGPLAPHAVHNTGSTPIHFYRIEFKRIDGAGLKDHWREWYPWMAKITDEYKVHPYVSNYY